MELGGQTLSATFSDLAERANGSVLVKYGETIVLVTAVMSKKTRDDIDYFPLTVDYEEKFYAAGKILGGRFQKREGKPSDEAILTGRIVDRTIRPLFNQEIRNEVQVIITVLSIDDRNDPDVPAVVGASLALGTSNIPWGGPVSAIRVGWDGTSYATNPGYAATATQNFDLLVCGRGGTVSMIEAEVGEVPETVVADALTYATAELEKLERWQTDIIVERKVAKAGGPSTYDQAPLMAVFNEVVSAKLDTVIFSGPGTERIDDLRDEWLAAAAARELPAGPALRLFEDAVNDRLHTAALTENRRPDGRAFDEVRPLHAEAGGLSSIVHGSGIFYRGGTHILTVLTLSGPKDSQLIEGMEGERTKYFMHHYNFPPFSTGETGRSGANRRAIGHGALAEKAIRQILPPRDTFPYTIRLVSEALASNGSTSMGSVCASSLALMDGGVPIRRPVAGIAVGLMMETPTNYKILTDIQGPEDHHGDMDFKVAGTTEGITAIQLDIKVDGVPVPILIEALTAARNARLKILEVITGALAAPRSAVLPSAPAITMIKIPTDKIGTVIGPGGKQIQKLCADTSTEIDIEDDGRVTITGKGPGVAAAKSAIEDLTREYLPGDRFDGQVVKIMEFGAFVRIGREAEGLVHISELAPFRVNRVEDVVHEGDTIPVVVKGTDDRGKIKLSLKDADPEYASRRGVQPSSAPNFGYNNGNGRNHHAPRHDANHHRDSESHPTRR